MLKEGVAADVPSLRKRCFGDRRTLVWSLYLCACGRTGVAGMAIYLCVDVECGYGLMLVWFPYLYEQPGSSAT